MDFYPDAFVHVFSTKVMLLTPVVFPLIFSFQNASNTTTIYQNFIQCG